MAMLPVLNQGFQSGERKNMMKELKEQGDSIHTGSILWDSSWPRLADEDERRAFFSYLEERFGIPEKIFASFQLFSRRKTWWLLRRPGTMPLPASLKVSQVGLKAFDQVGKYLKPSTRMAQMFGHHATKGVYHLSDDEFEKLLRAEPLEVDTEMEEGFVILCLRENVLCIGLLLRGTITSRIRQSELNQMTNK